MCTGPSTSRYPVREEAVSEVGDMAVENFHINATRPADGVIVVEVSGQIDITNSLAFQQRLMEELDEGATQVVLDLDDADQVDTTGMSVLLALAKRCEIEDRKLAIVCHGGWVRRALATTSLDQMIAVHATLEEALGRGGPAL
jgi:anti-sigma B factor antagonist